MKNTVRTNVCFCIMSTKELHMTAKTRLTIDMTPDQHMYLKMAATRRGVSMKDFVLHNMGKAIEEVEDEALAERCNKISADIKSGKIATISLEEFEKRMADV